mgnify:CR=1 FL=1
MNISVLFGSETGNAQALASQASEFLNTNGHSVSIKDLGDVSVNDLKKLENILIITSTWGDGEAPSNASNIHESLSNTQEDLSNTSFAVFAIGSTSFPQFCQAGIDFDTFLEKAGSKRLVDLEMADDDYSDSFPIWLAAIQSKLA